MDANAGKSRWFYPAPAWLVYGAAVATGVLFASERWRWFPVDYQKGWPVVLAVAVVAAVMILIPAWMLVGLVFRRRMQFGLRTLLVFVTLCALVCSWLAVRIKEARRQAEAVAAIEQKLHAEVGYDWEPETPREIITQSTRREPLGKLVGIDFLADVQTLSIAGPQVTDAALAELQALTRLRILWLDSNKVTDAGLSHLEGLTSLRDLELRYAKVTDKGVKRLHHCLPDCKIYINDERRY